MHFHGVVTHICMFFYELFKSCIPLKWVVYLFVIDLQMYFIHSRYKFSLDMYITNIFS